MWFYVQSELRKLMASYEGNDTNTFNRLLSIYNLTAEHYR